MLKKHSQVFEAVFIGTDLLIVSVAWVLSYWLRFYSGVFDIEKGVPPFYDYGKLLILAWLIWGAAFRRFGLYRTMRATSLIREQLRILRANSLALLVFLSVVYLFQEKTFEFSRLVFLNFYIVSTIGLLTSRSILRRLLWAMRRRGFNLRHAIVVGTGSLAADICRRIHSRPEYGIELIGCLQAEPTSPVSIVKDRNLMIKCEASFSPFSPVKETNFKVPIVGSYMDLPEFLESGRVDQVIVALPLSDNNKLERVLASIGDSIVDVKIVPDVHRFIQLGSEIQEFDGIPVVSMAATPLQGVNVLYKRVFDLLVGSLCSLFALPLIVAGALAVKLTSRGPVFFSQERVGLDGKPFRIHKLRTMVVDAERQGAKFAVKNDPRTTVVGAFLRKYSLDELPQLFNVIKGEMTLVGPRPERQVFIEEFRKRVPRYMLRHKVKAGMTGWAQINGFRGNTSIEGRIRKDLYYIENWSLLFDVKILIMTVFFGWCDNNAY